MSDPYTQLFPPNACFLSEATLNRGRRASILDKMDLDKWGDRPQDPEAKGEAGGRQLARVEPGRVGLVHHVPPGVEDPDHYPGVYSPRLVCHQVDDRLLPTARSKKVLSTAFQISPPSPSYATKSLKFSASPVPTFWISATMVSRWLSVEPVQSWVIMGTGIMG